MSVRMPFVLASSSPRRRDLLKRAGLSFEVVVSPAEEIHDASLPPATLCETNAFLKAAAVARTRPDATVIGADTLVFIDDLPLGKPADMDEARDMLRCLSGRTHLVCTGVCLIRPSGAPHAFHDVTEVVFRPLDEQIISEYFSRVNPLDKAGAYGIQEFGELLVEEIRGSFENVMGLPVAKLIGALG